MDEQAWHLRFVLQSLWTKPLRNYLYKRLNLGRESKILDLGSGTGALLAENLAVSPHVYGVDIQYSRSIFAIHQTPQAKIINSDACYLPFKSGVFDLSYCQYLLLWLKDPLKAVTEMKRVTRPGGTIIAFAEPDYQARIDVSEVFVDIGNLQNQSLAYQGVRLDAGRQLKFLFTAAGLKNVTMGMLSGEWKENTPEQFEMEWAMIAYDLAFIISQNEIKHLKEKARQAWAAENAMSFIPTFYAIGNVPE